MALINDYQEFLTSLDSSKFKTLRDAQKHILDQYRHYEQTLDVAIELPTGAGKTLIVLLIAEAWRRTGRKCAILSANKTLARQMRDEAEALQIPAILMEGRGPDIPQRDLRAYQRTVKIGIMNYWMYLNQNPVMEPADLLIMDDAHLAEHCLHSLFSVVISIYAHETLFKDLVSELAVRYPEYAVLSDALTPETSKFNTPPELLSFLDQTAVADRIREIIDASPSLESGH